MKKTILLLVYITTTLTWSQILISNKSEIHFFSSTPLENIEATSKQATAALNTQTGEISVNISIKSFKFSNTLMQEHFNENYMESEKYPTATFKGKISDIKTVNFNQEGQYTTEIKGLLTVHGVTKERTLNATIIINKNKTIGNLNFEIALKDHNIEVPEIVFQKIAEIIKVNVSFDFIPYVKK